VPIATECEWPYGAKIVDTSSPEDNRASTIAEDRSRGAIMWIQDSSEYIGADHKTPIRDTSGYQSGAICERVYETCANSGYVEGGDCSQPKMTCDLRCRRRADMVGGGCRKDQGVYCIKAGGFKCARPGLDS